MLQCGIGNVEQKEGVPRSGKEKVHRGIADIPCSLLRTHAGAAERCGKEGTAERNHCVLSMTPTPCTTQSWWVEEPGVKE